VPSNVNIDKRRGVVKTPDGGVSAAVSDQLSAFSQLKPEFYREKPTAEFGSLSA
jgi:hypothetical protein